MPARKIVTPPEREPGTGRWIKGSSGNPAGRARGCRNKSTILRKVVSEAEFEVIFQTTKEHALRGEKWTIKSLLACCLPRPKERSVDVSFRDIKSERDAIAAGKTWLEPETEPSALRADHADHELARDEEAPMSAYPSGGVEGEAGHVRESPETEGHIKSTESLKDRANPQLPQLAGDADTAAGQPKQENGASPAPESAARNSNFRQFQAPTGMSHRRGAMHFQLVSGGNRTTRPVEFGIESIQFIQTICIFL